MKHIKAILIAAALVVIPTVTYAAISPCSVPYGCTGVGSFSAGLVKSAGGTGVLTTTNDPVVRTITATSSTSTIAIADIPILKVGSTIISDFTAWFNSLFATKTTANLSDSTNKRYVTDANLTVINNTSGVNTGDQTNITGNAGTVTNGVYTTGAGTVYLAPSGSGASLTGVVHSESDPLFEAASTSLNYQAPLVSGTNIKTVNSTSLLGSGNVAVQPTLVSGTNLKTINSTSLLGSGDIAITGAPGGSATQLQYNSSGSFGGASHLIYDNSIGQLLVGTTSQSAARLEVNNQDASSVTGGLRIISTGTSGADYEIRMDSPNPDVEWIETDQDNAHGFGKYETDVNNDMFRINRRNLANDSFNTFVAFKGEDATNTGQIGFFTGFGVGYSRLDLVGTSTDDFLGITDTIANLTSGLNGNIFKIRNNGLVSIGSSTANTSDKLFVNGTTTTNGLKLPNLTSKILATDSNGNVVATTTGGTSGTVTSVATGFGISGGPITSSGTLTATNQGATYIVSTSTATGNYTTIQAAINAASTTPGLIHIRAGTYNISSALTLGGNNYIIEGEGVGTTIITYDGSVLATSTMTKTRTLDPSSNNNITIRNLEIDNLSSGNSTCIDGSNTTLLHIENVYCYGQKIGYYFDKSVYNSFDNLQAYIPQPASGSAYGIYLAGSADGTSHYANSFTFKGVTRIIIDPASTRVTGAYIDSQGVKFDDLDVESGAQYGIDVGADAVGLDIVPWLEGNINAVRLAANSTSVYFHGGEIAGQTSSNITNNGAVGFTNDSPTEKTVGGYDWNGNKYFTGGNFGIGSTSPNYRLTVQDVTAADSAVNTVQITGNTTFAKTTDFLNITANNSTDVGNPLHIVNPGKAASIYVQSGTVSIGTTATSSPLVVTTTATNATTSIEIGKTGQNKGSCLVLYRADGSAIYASVAAGATTFTLSTTSCK